MHVVVSHCILWLTEAENEYNVQCSYDLGEKKTVSIFPGPKGTFLISTHPLLSLRLQTWLRLKTFPFENSFTPHSQAHT